MNSFLSNIIYHDAEVSFPNENLIAGHAFVAWASTTTSFAGTGIVVFVAGR